MVRSKNKRAGKKKAKPKAPRAVVPRRILDARAYEYARLLSDPCSAALVHPTYAGGEAGFLFRADSLVTVGNGGTDNCGILHWTPGYVNTGSSELVAASGAGTGTSLTMVTNTQSPGKTFLASNASAARCVAACLKVIYPGAESTRSGRVHYGHTQAGVLDAGDLTTVDAVAPVVQHYSRTPPETLEVVWRPGAADTEFNDPRAGAVATLRDRKSAITVAFAGLPVATGLTFHLTAVYEWMPVAGNGISTNTSGKNPSGNTLDDVIDYIQASGFGWVRSASHAMGTGIGTGLITGISQTFGIMPVRQMGYGRQRLMQ